MKSKNSKIWTNQTILLEKFLSEENLSIAQITELLHCNRQSAYNYIKRLEENGYAFNKKILHGSTYYAMNRNTDSDDLLYRPVTADTLRKYTIARKLQYRPVPKETLRKKFAVCKENENCVIDDRIPLDIGESQYYSLINDLCREGDIELIPSKTTPSQQDYYLTGKNIPLQITLDFDNLYNLNIELSTITQGSTYYEQLNNLYQKTNVLLGMIDENVSYHDNYFVYGKRIDGLSNISTRLHPITRLDYKTKVLRVNYTTKREKNMEILLAVGMIVYSTEKDTLYLFGEEDPKKNDNTDSLYTIIDVRDITQAEETTYEHKSYHAEYFKSMFDFMFGISLEEPTAVKVAFDRVANVERKINYLKGQRKNAVVQIEDDKIIYSDIISGLSDFAMYLRKFGKSAHIIEPLQLKEKMRQSVERTLLRYEEASSNESS